MAFEATEISPAVRAIALLTAEAIPASDSRASFNAVRAAYQASPWALRVPISGPPLGPNNVAWLDNALAALADTPLTEQEKLSCVLLVSGFVRNDVTLALDFAEASGSEPQMPGYGQLLAKLISADEMPSLHRAIVSGSLDDPDDPDAEFIFGMARILDGIEALMTGKTSPRRRSARRR